VTGRAASAAARWLVAVTVLAGCAGETRGESASAPESMDWSTRSNQLLSHAGTPAADPVVAELHDLAVDHPSHVDHEFRARVALQLHGACRHAEALEVTAESRRLHPEAAVAIDELRERIRTDLAIVKAESLIPGCQTLRLARLEFLGHRLACLR
jgi:hypothetical protein